MVLGILNIKDIIEIFREILSPKLRTPNWQIYNHPKFNTNIGSILFSVESETTPFDLVFSYICITPIQFGKSVPCKSILIRNFTPRG